nr:MAG TPA: hypothetical protein [Caudoviricetes sp.]
MKIRLVRALIEMTVIAATLIEMVDALIENMK